MTGFAFAYAVMRVCGGQPRKNPGAPDDASLGNEVEHLWQHQIAGYEDCRPHVGLCFVVIQSVKSCTCFYNWFVFDVTINMQMERILPVL